MTRYGLPIFLVFDHGKQFDNDDIKAFLKAYHVKFSNSALCHPQSNGLVENEQVLAERLDLVEEVREREVLRLVAYLGKVARYYNIRVKKRVCQVEDLVLRKAPTL
ncbi:Gag-Pro-Pol polyprotein [Bienertia sinuspersici]